MQHMITTLHMHLYPVQNRKSSPSQTGSPNMDKGLQTSDMCGRSLPSSNEVPRFLRTGRGRLRHERRLPRCFQCPAPDRHQLLFSSQPFQQFPSSTLWRQLVSRQEEFYSPLELSKLLFVKKKRRRSSSPQVSMQWIKLSRSAWSRPPRRSSWITASPTATFNSTMIQSSKHKLNFKIVSCPRPRPGIHNSGGFVQLGNLARSSGKNITMDACAMTAL